MITLTYANKNNSLNVYLEVEHWPQEVEDITVYKFLLKDYVFCRGYLIKSAIYDGDATG